MRPSLTAIIVILAILFSLAAGVVIGGGISPWLRERGPTTISPNADMPVAPPTVTPPSSSKGVPTTVSMNTLLPTVTATIPSTQTPRPTVTATAEAVSFVDVQLVVEAEVSLRAGPSTRTAILTTLSSGETVRVIGRTEDWAWAQVVVITRDISGWVPAAARFVTLKGDVDAVPVTE